MIPARPMLAQAGISPALVGGIQEICAVIMYTYICDTEIVTRYEHVPCHGFRATARRPLASLRPEVAATLQMKARFHGSHANVYLDDKGNIIDTPEVLP